MTNLIISICDHSGAWTRPYAEAGYTVLRIDPKHAGRYGDNDGIVANTADPGLVLPIVRDMDDGGFGLGLTAGEFYDLVRHYGLGFVVSHVLARQVVDFESVGMIMQPPCTHFSGSGARWWPAKDADGRTAQAVGIVRECLRLKDFLRPDWWVMENPVGRIQKLVPELGDYRMWFHPCHYGDPYTKRTHLFGEFNPNLPRNDVEPVMYEKVSKTGKVMRGSWMWATLGGSSERTKELRSATPPGFARAFFEVNP